LGEVIGYDENMIYGIILAAGESSRMRIPKALLKIGEETFAEAIARKMMECGFVPVLIAGYHAHEIRENFKNRLQIEILENPHYQEGQFSSLKEGLKNLQNTNEGVIVWPVDQPLVKAETALAIVNAFQRGRSPVTIPVLQSKRGHPVVYGPEAVQTILSMDRSHTAKDLQAIYGDKISFVEVDDPGILIDIDTPEDYRQYIKDGVS
jgi:CTP:molybdopterin cytidylyltransferase MocA